MYAVEFSHRSSRDLINVAKKRTNVIPIIEDARHPHKYRMLMGGWDCVCAGVFHNNKSCLGNVGKYKLWDNLCHI